MAPTESKQKHPHHKNLSKSNEKVSKKPTSGKKGKGHHPFMKKKVSKVDKEIKEIENMQKRLEEIKGLEEEERQKIIRFDSLPISNYTKQGNIDEFLQMIGLREAGFVEMTDIQRSALLSALDGRDILGCAKTGSGKTLAFLIPALEKLYRERWDQEDGIGVIIISPIRELAIQIFDVLCTIGKYHSFSAGLVIGGKDLEEEQKRILTMNILVATPGRLLQHIEQTPGFDCTNLRCLVIDEVDRCLDMGFKKTIDYIVDSLGGDRQSQLYSATVSEKVKEMASSILTDPVHINVDSDDDYATPKTILQRYVLCELNQKVELLFSFIKSHLRCKILVFASSRKEVRFLYEAFRRMKPGIPLLHIHGKQKQTMRTYTYYDFLQKEQAVMFCTDVAARGLDFPSIDWVVQFDCPEDAESYIHRVGRAGRFRTKGNGLLFLLPSEEQGFLDLMADARIPLKRITVNPSKTQSVTRKLMEEVARDTELNHLAQKAFQSYLRSVYLASNKTIFNISTLPLDAFAESLGLGIVPNLSFLKKKKKSKDSYEMQQLQEEMKEEKKDKLEESSEDDEDDDLLMKTGKTTLSFKEDELPSLQERKSQRRLRINVNEESSKVMRFDDNGNLIKNESSIKDIDDIQDEVNAHAYSSRIASVKSQLEMNEEKDRTREKERIKEKKLIKKIKEKELNKVEPLTQVILGEEGDEDDEEENDVDDQMDEE